jgi:3-isopropylmalate/(R)-2-methylmalate dehydratase small subunit
LDNNALPSKTFEFISQLVLREEYCLKIKGKVHKYGANLDTDAIIPARYLNLSEAEELAQHCMEDVDPEFLTSVKPGDIIVADTNFFRKSINIGLPLLESVEAVDGTGAGDILEVDLATGKIVNVTRGKTFVAEPYPDFMMGIINAGGLIEYSKKKLAGEL